MLDIGLAFLVYLSPILLLGLVTAALGGSGGYGGRARRWYHSLRAARSTSSVGDSADARNVGPVLASDRERDEALQTLSDAVGEGRLGLDEAERRIDAVLNSRHRHDLEELVRDLPAHARHEVDARSSPSQARAGLIVVAVTGLVAAVVVQAAVGLWELWPVALAGSCLWAAHRRR